MLQKAIPPIMLHTMSKQSLKEGSRNSIQILWDSDLDNFAKPIQAIKIE